MLNILYEGAYVPILKGRDCLRMKEAIFRKQFWDTVQVLPLAPA